MWPWEHLAFGYLLYSMASRATDGSPPAGPAVVLVAIGTQLPDLVDKPLAWVFDVVPVAFAVGHSAVIAVPALLVAGLVVARHTPGRARLVAAYGVGHLSHLLGDVVYPALMGRGLQPERVLWPLVRIEGTDAHAGLAGHVTAYLRRYVGQLLAFELGPLFAVQVGLVGGMVLLWLVDGAPGPRTVWRVLGRLAYSSRS